MASLDLMLIGLSNILFRGDRLSDSSVNDLDFYLSALMRLPSPHVSRKEWSKKAPSRIQWGLVDWFGLAIRVDTQLCCDVLDSLRQATIAQALSRVICSRQTRITQ